VASLITRLGRLEEEHGRDYCKHQAPIVHMPDEPTVHRPMRCWCGLDPLVIHVVYVDGNDWRRDELM
jgi:hypothetical protein